MAVCATSCHVTKIVATDMATSQVLSRNGIDHADSNNANDAENANDTGEHSDSSEDDHPNWQ